MAPRTKSGAEQLVEVLKQVPAESVNAITKNLPDHMDSSGKRARIKNFTYWHALMVAKNLIDDVTGMQMKASGLMHEHGGILEQQTALVAPLSLYLIAQVLDKK